MPPPRRLARLLGPAVFALAAAAAPSAGAAWSPDVKAALAYVDRASGQQTLRGVFARLLRGLDAEHVLTPT